MYIWRFVVYPITIYGGQNVQEIHNFHVVLPALHRVAPGMKKERRLIQQLKRCMLIQLCTEFLL